MGPLCQTAQAHDAGQRSSSRWTTCGLGLSRKVEYLVDLALHFDQRRVHVKAWMAWSDDAIIPPNGRHSGYRPLDGGNVPDLHRCDRMCRRWTTSG